MYKSIVYGFAALFLMGSCSKENTVTPRSEVSVKYSDEAQYIIIEEVTAGRNGNSISLMADGFDDEHLKLHLPDASQPGKITDISAENISFSDGLDFESSEVVEGYVTLNSVTPAEVAGSFKVLLLDNVNGVERRWIEGTFKVIQDAPKP